LTVGSLAVAAAFTAPLAFLVWKTTGLGLDGVVTTLRQDAVGPLARTLLLATCVAASASVIGVGLAWLVTRSDVPGRRLWAVLAPVPLVIPSYVGAAALVAGLAPGGLIADALDAVGVGRLPDVRGFWGAWFVLTIFSYPYVYLPVAARLASLPPSYEESARLLGRRPAGVFRSVVLPQLSSAIGAGALLVFLYAISDFGAVSIMRYDTLTNELFQWKLSPDKWLPMSALLGVVAVGVVGAERSAARRQTLTQSIKARQPLQVPLGRWRWPALGFVLVVFIAALAAPMLVLGVWAARGFTSSTSSGAALADPASLSGPAIATMSISVTAAIVTVALVLPVAYLTTRYRTRSGSWANALVVSAFALPGLVIALALVYWTLQSDVMAWLYQTLPLLVLAYAVHFGAQALRSSQVAVAAVPARYDDAARMLGASRVRRFWTVDLPLIGPGLLAGGGLAMLSAMKELPATLLLAPPSFETLATRIWSATESHHLSQVGLASLVLVTMSGLLTWLLVIRRTERFG
jgi:iron(III) transport system permease protein